MISIVQAPRASAPYPWARFARWMAGAGLSAEQFQELLENGAEPDVVMAVGCVVDDSVKYPGLPTLDGQTIDLDPGVNYYAGGDPR